MDVGDIVVKPLKDFAKNSARLVKRCTKPDRKGGLGPRIPAAAARPQIASPPVCSRGVPTPPPPDMLLLPWRSPAPPPLPSAEFMKVCSRTAVGFIVMGFIGFFVKLLFIVSLLPASGPQEQRMCTASSAGGVAERLGTATLGWRGAWRLHAGGW